MSDEKEMKLVVPKSLMVALWLIAGGLFVNALPFDPIEQAGAFVELGGSKFKPVYVQLVTVGLQ